MTLSGDVLLAACLLYVAALFVIAFLVDRVAKRRRVRWLSSPIVYTLSISVYCTSWTFYGAVGSAARNGLEFITIYLGPTLVFVGWWWLLRKLVRIGREQRITSIADMISSRFGKSPSIAVLVTVIALTATTPYIALQLQSVTRSYQAVSGGGDGSTTTLWVAVGMAVFTILFGTRSLDSSERHYGVVAAIAVEAVVKLIALVAVGIFVVVGAGGVGEIFADVPVDVIYGSDEIFGPRWATLMFLSATAVICLPRQFHVTVVENADERNLATASWLFPLYLFGMCIFIVPIAVVGLKTMPLGSNPDLYVLTLPLAEGQSELALLAFLGGFSSATSMVIVAAIAVSTMVSNHIVMPIALRFMTRGKEVSDDVRNLLLTSRRVSIAMVLGLGYLYLQLSGGSGSLAAIGLIAFAGVAQFLPALLGGIFWRGANRQGALAGLAGGVMLWAYTLFLPSLGDGVAFSAGVLANGPFGIEALRPQALLGLTGMDPLVHAMVCSMGVNVLLFLSFSVLTEESALERIQAVRFVDVFRTSSGGNITFQADSRDVQALFVLAQRIMGRDAALRLFERLARDQGRTQGLPEPTDLMLQRLERELAGSVGAASAHAMVTQITGQVPLGMNQLIDIADETQRLIETSRQLSDKSAELEQTASQLREANELMRTADARKDDFLSQVSHELRTPMTSIRSFSEILREPDGVAEPYRQRFLGIINDESNRLTRLLDEILDLSRLEAGSLDIPLLESDVHDLAHDTIDTITALASQNHVIVDTVLEARQPLAQINSDRLRQVLLNLLSNAIKYNQNAAPRVTVRSSNHHDWLYLDVIDNGGGVSAPEARTIFEKFARGERAHLDQGAGLGLPISRALMHAMGGDLTVEFNSDGTSFFRAAVRTRADLLGQAAE
ncbi:MAG: ATP-binding protein [Paracoccaceae bacterium]